MKIKELREMLASIPVEFDECEVLTPGSDHSYERASDATLCEYVIEKARGSSRPVLGEWYGHTEDYGYSSMKTFKAAGHKLTKGLIIS